MRETLSCGKHYIGLIYKQFDNMVPGQVHALNLFELRCQSGVHAAWSSILHRQVVVNIADMKQV